MDRRHAMLRRQVRKKFGLDRRAKWLDQIAEPGLSTSWSARQPTEIHETYPVRWFQPPSNGPGLTERAAGYPYSTVAIGLSAFATMRFHISFRALAGCRKRMLT